MPQVIILSDEEIKSHLKDIPGWEYHDNKIKKTFKFKDFVDSLNFVLKLAPFCEANQQLLLSHLWFR